jgi:hypothetical protein
MWKKLKNFLAIENASAYPISQLPFVTDSNCHDSTPPRQSDADALPQAAASFRFLGCPVVDERSVACSQNQSGFLR